MRARRQSLFTTVRPIRRASASIRKSVTNTLGIAWRHRFLVLQHLPSQKFGRSFAAHLHRMYDAHQVQ